MGWIDESFSTIVHVTSFHLGAAADVHPGWHQNSPLNGCWKLDRWGLFLLDQQTPVTCSDYLGRSGIKWNKTSTQLLEFLESLKDHKDQQNMPTQPVAHPACCFFHQPKAAGLAESSLDISLQDPFGRNSQVTVATQPVYGMDTLW